VITAVLFDFGGVILSSPFEAFNAYEEANGLPKDFIRGLNATNPDTNAWAQFERSEVDVETFCELFEAEAQAAGHTFDAREILEQLRGEVRPEMVEALRRIKAEGLPLALLTNNIVVDREGHTDDEVRADLEEAMGMFDLVIESSKAGVRKPDPAAYQLVLDELGKPADEVVFIDDLGINLKPARAMGMTTIKFLTPEQALTDLEAAVGFPLR
jgi:putative hydrolase of the HAD superfamily